MAKKVKPQTPQNKWLKVLQFFAAYLVAAWTFLQFLDWALTRYNISPHWVDMMLWLFIGIVPSLLIYLYHKERIQNRVFRRNEKIIFPLNAAILAIVLYFGFGNNDLGATTKSVNYATSLGSTKTALITKEEFRADVPICNFEPLTKDSSYAWMEMGISTLLDLDLSQNKNLSPIRYDVKSATDKVKYVNKLYDSYVDGQFEITDSFYVINVYIRNSANAKVLTQETFKSDDLLNLVDNITVFVTNYFAPVKLNMPYYLDLKVRDFTSNSLKAIEHYTQSDYKNAIKEDSTFALAYLDYVKYSLNQNIGKLEERKQADKAYEYREKLPIQKQSETLIMKNLAWDQLENAEELTKIQLTINPRDDTYKSILLQIYGRTKNTKAIVDLGFTAWKENHDIINAIFYLYACFLKGDYNRVLKVLNTLELFESVQDEIISLKIMPQLLKGDTKEAQETQNKIKLLHPDWENTTKVYDKVLAYLKDHKVTENDMQKFEGEYRSNIGEMTIDTWIEKNILFMYASNQQIMPMFIGGDSTLITGIAGEMTIEKTFFQNKDNGFYIIKSEQNYLKETNVYWYWKIDDNIKKAELLLEEGKLDIAEIAYTIAIEENPKHYYLKDALVHINYIKSIDSLTLINQYKEVEGTYGPRVFWVEDGKLFYNQTDNKRLGQVQLLPISENRYINLTRLRDNLDFEFKDGKAIASFAWQFDCEKMEWVKADSKVNYFRKDENKGTTITTL